MTVSEMARQTGVSVRTLHYYDKIGLLPPDSVDAQNGYRYYGAPALLRLRQILFYRELEFPLQEIQKLLADPEISTDAVLLRQRALLRLKLERLTGLLETIDKTIKGEMDMNDFQAFDNSDYEQARAAYAEEVRECWGETDAYREHAKKTAGYSKEDFAAAQQAGDAIMQQFAARLQAGGSPTDAETTALCKAWQAHITQHYYTCTREILAGLAQMYTGDPRFTENIDRFGVGTAEFMSAALTAFCTAD